MKKPVIALTMGDPAGIGPEIAVKAAANPELSGMAEIIVYGCPDIIKTAAERFANGRMPQVEPIGDLRLEEVAVAEASAPCGIAARNAVIQATKDAIAGKVDAIVTAPMNKASVNLAGIPFTGHTELVAELCNCDSFAMMQSAGKLRVAFVTTHIPLSDVPAEATAERISEVAHLLENAVKAEGIDSPKLAAAAINPHAGENGYMGNEDETTVKPTLAKLQSEGMNIDGPFPPDTLFIETIRSKYDGILSMYHDQGHIPFKMLAFDRGVNSTLGLPIIRTSVDHGTAFEIAWQGVADTGSLEAAVRLAVIRAKHK
ncbi:MAG: 4-hydroxythreonine-4-phosphate dehydrogenase PdxA [Lentisphaerae bacterium]|nr:4-hydroxythreonine-4-phosphate dehydrogenase PdxA [Lentisphaerota bacterium]MCP4102669.1 4-hydroxythreonine-4-phosphate dehydrogenase PdxA [Lentisphaerota bacterium]